MNSLKSLIKTHVDWILMAFGILIAGSIIWILVWGVTVLAQNMGASLGAPRVQDAGDKFDIEKAAGLDFRGLE
jgi:hypothetical protein